MSMESRMFEGNLALDIYKVGKPSFSVVPGGLVNEPSLQVIHPRLVVRDSRAAKAPVQVRVRARLVAAATCIVLGCILLAIGSSLIAFAHRAQAIENVSYERIQVRLGDSIWSISEEHPVDGLSTQDVEDLIQEQNGLQRLSVQPGVTLLVPSSK